MRLAIGPAPSTAATIHVPADYPTIQAAIDAAAANDIILVAPGTYDENLNTQGKPLTLRGEGGAQATVVDGGRRGGVLLLRGGGTVEGFTLRGGLGGGGLRVIDPVAPVIIRRNIIEDNIAGYFVDSGAGGGIYLGGTVQGALIEENQIRNNYAGDSGGGIYNLAAPNQLRNNVIVGNGCHVGGGGIYSFTSVVSGNLIMNNWSDSFGGGINAAYGEIRNNTIVGNYTTRNLNSGAGIHISPAGFGDVLITNNIVARNHGQGIGDNTVGIYCNSSAVVRCNDSWGHAGGDFVACDTTGGRNFSLDPLFCGELVQDFRLSELSRCAPPLSGDCGLIGAFPVGCAVVPTRRASWGRIKVLHR